MGGIQEATKILDSLKPTADSTGLNSTTLPKANKQTSHRKSKGFYFTVSAAADAAGVKLFTLKRFLLCMAQG